MDAIFKRKSVRRYTSQDVPDDLVKQVLAAAMSAPSAGNEQPWHFIVIKDKEILKKLSALSPYARALAEAPLGIVVCVDLNLERHKGYWVQDCSAAVENILIEVTALGLGAVWLSVYPLEERIRYVKECFILPPTIIPFAVVPVGYPSQEVVVSERYDHSRLHYEKW
jgi:nitroreductase